MIQKSLITERGIVFVAQEQGGTAGATFNGAAAGSTTATAMLQATCASGKGIDVTKANRARVIVLAGAASDTATITAWITPGLVKADDASIRQLSGFQIDLTASTDHKNYVGEIDLRGLTPVDSATSGADNTKTWLWMKSDSDGTAVAILVELFDYENDPALDSAPTPAPQVVTTVYPSSIA